NCRDHGVAGQLPVEANISRTMIRTPERVAMRLKSFNLLNALSMRPAQLVDTLAKAERLFPVATIWNGPAWFRAHAGLRATRPYYRPCRRASVSTASLCEREALRPGNRVLQLWSTRWR